MKDELQIGSGAIEPSATADRSRVLSGRGVVRYILLDESKRTAIGALSRHSQESCHKTVASIVRDRLAVDE